MLWLHHPFLGSEPEKLDGIARAIEKVLNNIDDVRDTPAASLSTRAAAR
jgi:hypothetical protein